LLIPIHQLFTETELVGRTQKIGIAGTVGGAVLMALQLSGMLNSHPVKIAIDFAVIALFVLVAVFPSRLNLLGAACLTAGLSIIVFGAHILGFMYYIAALTVFLKAGVFRKKTHMRLGFFVLLLLAAVASQYRLGMNKVIISLVNIVIASLIVALLAYLFYDALYSYFRKRDTLVLADYPLTSRQLACIAGCLARRTTREISDALIVSDSVVKKELVECYQLFNVSDMTALYALLASRDIVWPEGFCNPFRE